MSDFTVDLSCRSCQRWLAEVFVDEGGRVGWRDHPSPLIRAYDDVQEYRADVAETDFEGVAGFAACCRTCGYSDAGVWRWISINEILGHAERARRSGQSKVSVSM